MNALAERIRVRLSRLSPGDIEQVRVWRNAPHVRDRMIYREHISADDQKRWFATVNNDRNYFFVVRHDGRPVGIVNVKDVDRESGTGETGVFFGEPDDASRGIVAFSAAIALNGFAFRQLGLRQLHGRILRDNPRAIRYSVGLGYELSDGQDGVENQLYTLTPDRFDRRAAAAHGMIERLVSLSVESQILA